MIDHSQCTHPRTPAGRAACRKLRDEIKTEHGAGTDQRANFQAAVAYDKARTRRAAKSGKTPRTCGHPGYIEDGRCPLGHGAEPIVKRREKPAAVRTTVTGGVVTTKARQARTRVLRGPGDLADVPHVFGAVIRLAWERDWDVRTGDVYNDNERNIKITSDHGTAILTWRVSVPFGIHAIAWRSKDTSVTSRCGTVNDAIRLLENDMLPMWNTTDRPNR